MQTDFSVITAITTSGVLPDLLAISSAILAARLGLSHFLMSTLYFTINPFPCLLGFYKSA
jgi:hypothetical protein